MQNYKDLMEDYLLSSGETQGLEDMQSQFNMIYGEAELEEDLWDFDQDKFIVDQEARSELHQILMDKIQYIHNIPAYKYVIQYFMIRYKLYIDDNEDALWKLIEEEKYQIKKYKEKEIKAFRETLHFSVGEEAPKLTEQDLNMLVNSIYYELAREYKQVSGKTLPIKTFCGIMHTMNLDQLNELALILKMDMTSYRFFRKKVLHVRAVDYYDLENLLILLVLKYAPICQIANYQEAMEILEEFYGHLDIDEVDVEASQAIGHDFTELLKEDFADRIFKEEIDQLKTVLSKVESSKQREFSVYAKRRYENKKATGDENGLKYVEAIYYMTSNNAVKVLLSFMEEKKEECKNHEGILQEIMEKSSKTTSLKKVIKYIDQAMDSARKENVDDFEQLHGLLASIQQQAKHLKEINLIDYMEELLEEAGREDPASVEEITQMIKRSQKEYKLTRGPEATFLQLWNELFENIMDYEYSLMELYNNDRNVINKQTIYRFLYGDRFHVKSDEMVKMAPDQIRNFYLDSMEFMETKINDNTFSQFPEDENRQRNLLLTLLFLNYIYDDAFDPEDDYMDTITEFEIEANRLLMQLGFVSFGPGNAYDAWISLLLSCNSPLELFRYIWFEKTASN